jgi:DNA-binding beta-propeller fold protein YncE
MITALLAAAAVAAAEPPRSVLFVGNSFTFGADSDAMTYRKNSVTDLNGEGMGGVPALFKRFADEAGLPYSVSLETAAGQTLAWHLAHKRALIDRSWDAVVLQQYSTLDPDKPGDVSDTIPAARSLTALFRQRNPRVDISLVATWTRPDLTYPPGKHWSGQPVERMALDLRKADDQVKAAVPAISRVAPVGEAFNCAIARKVADANPYDGLTPGRIDLWANDHYHASNEGYYLEALTIFTSVTRKDPRKLGGNEAAARDLGIGPPLAAKLQDIAFHVGMIGRCAPLVTDAPAAEPATQVLPTGQALTPLATPGARFSPLVVHTGPYPSYVADGAAAIAVSPDKREMLVLTSGYNRFNGPDGKVVERQSTQYVLRYAIDGQGARWLETRQVPNSFGGISWSPDGRAFIVGGGVDDALYVFTRRESGFVLTGKIALGHKAGLGANVRPQAAGVAFSPDGRRALVANYYNDSVSLVDLVARKVVAEQDLRPGTIDASARGVPGGEFPFAAVWVDGSRAWLSSPRDRQLVGLVVRGDEIRVTGRVATIGEPTAILVDRNSRRLIATEDNADRLAFIDLRSGELVAEPRLALPESLAAPQLGKGLNPNGLAILPDGRLLVTLGGINAVAIVAPGDAENPVQSLIPTGWYPSSVATSANGGRVFVVNRKSPPGPNAQGCPPELAVYRGQPEACGAANQYIYQLEKAGLLEFPFPDERGLAVTTLQVAQNIGLSGRAERVAAEARMAEIRKRVKHVVFIIKENRTYDQVLGDLDIGDGDPHLAILGGALTPNHHRLARQFVTLDNFYVSGEVSATGWAWSTAARATDLIEKTAPVNYADRGLAYEAEEADRFIYTQQFAAQRRATNPQLSADPDLLPGPALLTAADPDDDGRPNEGFLWDAAIRAGVSVRNYGFADASIYDTGAPGSVPLVREPFSEKRQIYAPGDRLLASRSDRYFRGFDMKLADYWRVLEWRREYDEQEAAGTLPQLTLLRLAHDHFGDFDKAIDGVSSVETQMADNDYSLGLIVERISRGKAADSTLIFVIEDDAQNGADHVDARRSLAFVVGPYVRQNVLVSTRYTTINVLRTIEAVLGLEPLGLNDALAMPMADLFDTGQSQWSYRAEAAEVLQTTNLPIPAERFVTKRLSAINCTNHNAGYWAAAMKGQNFAGEDRLDTDAFNRALWRGLGSGPEPLLRDARDLREGRRVRIKDMKPAACASPTDSIPDRY